MATERIPLTQPIESRDGSFAKDSFSSNCFFETRDQKREFVKRPGLVALGQIVETTYPDLSNSQGLVGFNSNLISVINNKLYLTTTSSYATTFLGDTSDSTSNSYFVRTFLDTYMFFHNGVNGYLLSAENVFSSPTGMPTTPFVPGCAFLDNYVFVGTTNNRIYNCDVGDPTNWDSLSYISFEQGADLLVGICSHLNYIVAFVIIYFT